MIDYQLKDGVAYLKMDDGKANVFAKSMSADLRAKLSQAEEEAKATVLMGRESQFSAGYDLSVMQAGDPKAKFEMVIAGFEMLCQVAAHPQPMIAACTGNAFGLGAFILLVADTRIAIDQESKICLPETRAGMIFPPLLVAAARARLNPAKYVEAALQSQVYSPKSAIEAGFIDQVAAPEEFLKVVEATATSLAELPTKAYGRNKRDLLADKLTTMRESFEKIASDPSSIS